MKLEEVVTAEVLEAETSVAAMGFKCHTEQLHGEHDKQVSNNSMQLFSVCTIRTCGFSNVFLFPCISTFSLYIAIY